MLGKRGERGTVLDTTNGCVYRFYRLWILGWGCGAPALALWGGELGRLCWDGIVS